MPFPARAPTASSVHGPEPAPTKTCSVHGGQWTKSHCLQRTLLALDQQQALAGQDEEILLVLLAVVHARRLPRLEDADVEAELREALIAFEARVGTVVTLEPARLAGVDDEPALALRREAFADTVERCLGNHQTLIR